MENMGIVQARTPEALKENANHILEKLGLNMSTYINMALNQLVIQEGIPFQVKLSNSLYTDSEKIDEVAATLRIEGMELKRYRDVKRHKKRKFEFYKSQRKNIK